MSDGARQRMLRVIAAVLGLAPDRVGDGTAQDGVESWDSLAHIHLVVALEAEFGVSFPPEQALELTSVPAIWAALRAAGAVDG